MKNKKTATITWLKYNNFGTYLQAYALQQAIMSLGYENHILDDSSIISHPYPYRVRFFVSLLLTQLIPVRRRYLHAQRKSDALYVRFADEHLIVDKVSAAVQEKADHLYDQYICGSDQIWCPVLEEHLNPYYYAAFTHKKKIAYAASFGVEKYPDKLRNEFTSLVGQFAAISCREEIGCHFVHDMLGKEAIHVSDPTLLLSDEEWRRIAESAVCTEDGERYMLTYFLTPNKWYVDFARRYASEHGLKLRTFYLRPSSVQEADEAVTAGPAEFIRLIDHADIFFTDSFHGSIFATLMQTPFVGFQRFPNENGGQNHRLINLYHLMAIKDRFIVDEDGCDIVRRLSPMDFVQMKKRLQPFIDNSKNELSHSLAI